MIDLSEVKVLVIDDDTAIQQTFYRALSLAGYQVDVVSAGRDALERLNARRYDIVVVDAQLPDIHGLHLLSRIKELYPFIEVLVVTGFGTIDLAVEAIKLGAFHFLTKPVTGDEIRQNIKNMLDKISMKQEIHKLRWQLSEQYEFHNMLGRSLAMQEVFMQIRKIAPSTANVLIFGESGTGKELAAQAIHAESKRRNAPFIAINCSALAEGTIESELFGHEKGAFTGAYRKRKGFIEEADGGTLFLDEISTLKNSIQIMLLRVIQEREFHPVGSSRKLTSNVRFIAATNTPLEKLVEQGRFREDLYYRLNVVNLNMPPLRERGEDIHIFFQHFIKYYGEQQNRQIEGIEAKAQEILSKHSWPGNVRELKNVCESAVMMAEDNQIRRADLPEYLLNSNSSLGLLDNDGDYKNLNYLLCQEKNFKNAKNVWNGYFEKKFICRVLKETKGSVTQAANEIGMARPALQRLMKKYRIKRESFK